MTYTTIDYIFNFIPDHLRTMIGDDNFIFTEAHKALSKVLGAYQPKTVFNEEFTVTNHILQFEYEPWKVFVYDEDNCKVFFDKVNIPTREDQYSHNDNILTFFAENITIYMDYIVYTDKIRKDVNELWEYLAHWVEAEHWRKRAYFKESGAIDMQQMAKREAYQKRLAAIRKLTPMNSRRLRENLYK